MSMGAGAGSWVWSLVFGAGREGAFKDADVDFKASSRACISGVGTEGTLAAMR